MRGVHSVVDDIRRNVFTEVARLAYEGGDYKQADMIPFKLVSGEWPSTAAIFSWSVPWLPPVYVWPSAWSSTPRAARLP